MIQSADELAMLEIKRNWGKYLLRMAWVIEISAALLGIAIAFITGYQTYIQNLNEFGELPIPQYFNLLLGTLPFFMVAAVEILKIPLCFLVFTSNSFKVRSIFTLVLIAITFITFETLATGFERFFHSASTTVQIPQDKLVAITKKIEFNKGQVENKEIVSDESIKQEVDFRTNAAKASLNDAIDNMEEQIEDYLNLGGGTLTEQKEQKELKLDRLINERIEQIAKISKEASARRNSKNIDIKKIKEQRDTDASNAKEFSEAERERITNEIQAITDALEVSINNKKEFFVGAIEADNQNQTAKIIAIT